MLYNKLTERLIYEKIYNHYDSTKVKQIYLYTQHTFKAMLLKIYTCFERLDLKCAYTIIPIPCNQFSSSSTVLWSNPVPNKLMLNPTVCRS